MKHEGVYRRRSTWSYRIQWSEGGRRTGIHESGFPSAEVAAEARKKRLATIRPNRSNPGGYLLWLLPGGAYSVVTPIVAAYFCPEHGIEEARECEAAEPLFRISPIKGPPPRWLDPKPRR